MRGTKVQAEARINSLIQLLVDDRRTKDVLAFVAEQEQTPGSPWHLKDGEKPRKYAAIMKALGQARVAIASDGIGDMEQLRAIARQKYLSLYETAMEQGELRVAKACIDAEAKLLGLFPKDPGKGQGNNYVAFNGTTVFARAADIAEQLALVGRIPPRAIPCHGDGEPLAEAQADTEAIRLPASS